MCLENLIKIIRDKAIRIMQLSAAGYNLSINSTQENHDNDIGLTRIFLFI